MYGPTHCISRRIKGFQKKVLYSYRLTDLLTNLLKDIMIHRGAPLPKMLPFFRI